MAISTLRYPKIIPKQSLISAPTANITIQSIVEDPVAPVTTVVSDLPTSLSEIVIKLLPKTFQVNITDSGETSFNLPSIPQMPETLTLIVNGLVYRSPSIILSSSNVVWLNDNFILDPTDLVYVQYV